MKKTVRIRKANPGETGTFINKHQAQLKQFFNGGSNTTTPEQRLKVFMLSAYKNLKQGSDPETEFARLVSMGLDEKLAEYIILKSLKSLSDEGYANPAYSEDEETDEQSENAAQQQDTQEQQPVAQNDDSMYGEEEDLALSDMEYNNSYPDEAMDYYNEDDETEESNIEQGFKYGGYYNNGGYAEQVILDQYNYPGNSGDFIPTDLTTISADVIGGVPLNTINSIQSYLPGTYTPVFDNNLSTEMLPMGKYGGSLLPEFQGGGKKKGKKGKRKRIKKEKQEEKEDFRQEQIIEEDAPSESQREQIGTTITPQESTGTPGMIDRLRNYYTKQTAYTENPGFLDYTGATMYGINPMRLKQKFREKQMPQTSALKTLSDAMKIVEGKGEKDLEVVTKNEDGTYSTGLSFELDAEQIKQLFKIAEKANEEFNNGESKNLDLSEVMDQRRGILEQIANSLNTPEISQSNIFNIYDYGIKGPRQVNVTKGSNGLITISFENNVNTGLKGYGNKKGSVPFKDIIHIDLKKGEILDNDGKPLTPKTETFYKGQTQNWYQRNLDPNKPFEISPEPFRTQPPSWWRTGYNLVGKPLIMTPMSYFGLPNYARKTSFSPNAEKVNTTGLTRSMEAGMEAGEGQPTEGLYAAETEPFGTKWEDYQRLQRINEARGINTFKTLGILGGLGTAGYFLSQGGDEDMTDRPMFVGKGDTGDLEFFPTDSLYSPTYHPFNRDSINDPRYRSWQGMSDGMKKRLYLDSIYNAEQNASGQKKKGGMPSKKQFYKNILKIFDDGGSSLDQEETTSQSELRTDDLKGSVEQKKSWIEKTKELANRASTDKLYKAVQESGDPKLINIFMNNQQDQQPNMGMQQNTEIPEGYHQMPDGSIMADSEHEDPMMTPQMQQPMMAEGGFMDPCPPGQYWDGTRCVDFGTGIPPIEHIWDNPEILDYIDKLNKYKNVEDYKDFRLDKFNNFINDNYKGPRDERNFPVHDSEEWRNFENSKEYQQLRKELPNPMSKDEPFRFPKGYEQKNYFPKDQEWDEESIKTYNRFFNPKPEEWRLNQKIVRDYIEKNPRLKREYDDIEEGTYDQYMYEKNKLEEIPEDDPSREFKFKGLDLQQEKYDDWCPCKKVEEIIVQGQPVQQTICVPCEQAQEGGYVNINAEDPLTRFVYGGNDSMMQESLPMARNGYVTPPPMSYGEWQQDYISKDNWPGAYADNDPDDDAFGADPQEVIDYNNWYSGWSENTQDAADARYQQYQDYLDFAKPYDPWANAPKAKKVQRYVYGPANMSIWNQFIPANLGIRRYSRPNLLDLYGHKPIAEFRKNWFSPKFKYYGPATEDNMKILADMYGGRKSNKMSKKLLNNISNMSLNRTNRQDMMKDFIKSDQGFTDADFQGMSKRNVRDLYRDLNNKGPRYNNIGRTVRGTLNNIENAASNAFNKTFNEGKLRQFFTRATKNK